MSEGESFLARWSARKLADRTEAARADKHPEEPPREAPNAVDNGATIAGTPNDPVAPEDHAADRAPLPPLDSIGADSSVAAFLRPDVPVELTRAALRRAWTSDPAIKNFVGLVENGWDFNDPSAMHGFGAITPQEVARLAGQVIAALPQDDAGQPALEDASTTETKSAGAIPGAPAAAREVASETAETGSDVGHDAAQQNATDKATDKNTGSAFFSAWRVMFAITF
jgi:Protein of unknown function (DUF3306)